MGVDFVRAIIALIVVGVFMGITGFLAIFPLVTAQKIDTSLYADFFVKTSGIYTGIIGVIIGYYFGRSHESVKTKGKEAAGSEGA